MTGILKVDQWKDSGDNALMTSDGAGNLTVNTPLKTSGNMTLDSEGNISLSALTDITYQTTSTNSTAGHHIFKSYNTEIMRVDGGTNKVGIGTASPTDFLDVRGSIKARDASDNVGRFHTRNAFTVTNGTAVQLTSVCGSAIVCVSCNTTGAGGLFWGTFSTSVSKLAGDGLTSDSGTSDIAVYKSSSSNLMYFKNRSGFSRDYVITVYAARHA